MVGFRRAVIVNTGAIEQAHGFKRDELKWGIAPRTLSHRVKNQERLTRDESAKAIRGARLTVRAETVFADSEKARRWLSNERINAKRSGLALAWLISC